MKKAKYLLAVLAATMLMAGCESMFGPDPVAQAVQADLKKDQYVGKFDIKADHQGDGTVQLTGNVNNDFQKYQAEAVAKKTSGVKKVDNKIKVN